MDGVSLVVPIYNEEENVILLYQELDDVMRRMGCDYELIFVDDGSSDNSLSKISEKTENDPNLRVIQFRKNFGQTAAMAAGMQHSRFSVVVTLDGDLQNDPYEIPKLVRKLNEGYDLVVGWRKDRKDKFLSRKLPSMIANKIISCSTNVRLHDYGCSLKAMTGEVARGIQLYGEMHRFIPAMADQMGAKITELPVNHRPRRFGKTKYGLSRTVRVVLDLITVKFLLGYSKRPIHLFGFLGLIFGAGGGFILSVMTIQKIFMGVPMGSRPLLLLGVMLVIIGLQFLVFGLLAEVLARTYYESQNKKTYVVWRYLNCPEFAAGDAATTDQDLARSVWNKKAV